METREAQGRTPGYARLTIERCDGTRETFATVNAPPMGHPDCVWTEDGDMWEAECAPAEAWQFNDGGPAENGFKHCPYCGRPLKVFEGSDDEA